MGSKRHGAIAPGDGEYSPPALDFVIQSISLSVHFHLIKQRYQDIRAFRTTRTSRPRAYMYSNSVFPGNPFCMVTAFASRIAFHLCNLYRHNYAIDCSCIRSELYRHTYIGTGTCLIGQEIIRRNTLSISLSGSRPSSGCRSNQLPTLARPRTRSRLTAAGWLAGSASSLG